MTRQEPHLVPALQQFRDRAHPDYPAAARDENAHDASMHSNGDFWNEL
jgi:hypothetical protein